MQLCFFICMAVCFAALAQCTEVPLSAAVQQAIVDKHNELRSKVAKGLQDKQPKAGNMNKLKWYAPLATTAQTWAETRVAANCGEMEHGDLSKRQVDSKTPGENAAMGWGDVSARTEAELIKMVQKFTADWYSEVYDPSVWTYGPISDDEDEYPVRGHYTQVVWAETTLVGCGVSSCEVEGDPTHYQMYCNYLNAGNMPGEPPYKTSDKAPCDSCWEGATCDKAGDGLCIGGTPPKDDSSGAPPPGAPPPSGGCADDWSDCADYVDQCMFDKDIFDNCKKTCNQCAKPPGAVPCGNKWSNCKELDCSIEYVKKNCPKKCGVTNCKVEF